MRTLLLLAMTSLLPTASVAAPKPQATPVWAIDYGEQRCTLFRKFSDPQVTLGIRMIPGLNAPEVMIADHAGNTIRDRVGEAVTIALGPGEARVEGRAATTKLPDSHLNVLQVDRLGPDFLERFASASSIEVGGGGQAAALTLPLSGTRKAVEALRACNDALLTAWGVDPKAGEKLQRPPEGSLAGALRDSDYPKSALMRGTQGSVVVRYVVGVDGRITDCAVVGTSGDSNLDFTTCDSIKRRGRMGPALDQNGKPTPVVGVTTVTWSIN